MGVYSSGVGFPFIKWWLLFGFQESLYIARRPLKALLSGVHSAGLIVLVRRFRQQSWRWHRVGGVEKLLEIG